MRILGIDPGNTRTAHAVITDGKICEYGYAENETAISDIVDAACGSDAVVCEMIASYGMAVGKTVFETCVFIGRLLERIPDMQLVTRNAVKLAICKSPKANDSNIRQALIDIYGPQGTKKNPGPTFGFAKDKWAALAVATAYAQGDLKLYEFSK